MKQKPSQIKLFAVLIIFNINIFTAFIASAQKSLAITNGKETITKDALMKKLGRSLTKAELKEVEPFINQSFKGINSKDKEQIQGGIHDFSNSTVIALTKWIGCGDYCETNNAPEYGFCYWRCIFNGGPPKKKPSTN